MMMTMMVASVKTMLWTVIMLGLLYYTFSIILLYGVVQYFEDTSGPPVAKTFIQNGTTYTILQDKADAKHDYDIRQHFGSVWRSMRTLFQTMTGGYDWIEIADELKIVGYFNYYVLIVFIIFMVFGMLNIILGMFCEQAYNVAAADQDRVIAEEKKRSDGFIKDVKEVFYEIDVDGTGKISWEEFMTLSKDPRVQAYLHFLSVDAVDAMHLFKAFAGNTDSVDIDVFVTELNRVKGDAFRHQVIGIEKDLLVNMKQTKLFLEWFKEKTAALYPHLALHASCEVPHTKEHPRARATSKAIEAALQTLLNKQTQSAI
jgi:hypothetical protein